MHPQQPNPYAPYAPPAPRNGAGTAALILGLVGLPFFLTGLTALVSIVLGLVAIPLALTGLSQVRRREATNRGTAVIGLILGALALALGTWSVVVTVQAVAEALDEPTATVAGSGKQAAGPRALGTTVDVDGLAVTVRKIVTTRDGLGTLLHCADVSYENRSADRASRNPYDWSARNARGASVNPWPYAGGNALDSGDLAPGGTDSGLVCFDVPRDEVAVVEYTASPFDDGPAAEWVTR